MEEKYWLALLLIGMSIFAPLYLYFRKKQLLKNKTVILGLILGVGECLYVVFQIFRDI